MSKALIALFWLGFASHQSSHVCCAHASPAATTLDPFSASSQLSELHDGPHNHRHIQEQQSAFPNLFFWNLWQGGQQVALQEGAVLGIDKDTVLHTWDGITPISDKLGLTGSPDLFNGEWAGLWMRGNRTCMADNADRLAEAVQSSACQIVLLIPGAVYDIEQDMDVYEDKTIIGSPTLRPILNGAEAERIFDVHGGASLDIRHILFYEGEGDEYATFLRTRFGGVVRVAPGGYLFAFDCLFTIQAHREAFINHEQEFIFGGDVLIEGGRADFIGCSMFAITPGFVNTVSVEFGGSVLVLGGVVTFTASNFMTSQIFGLNSGGGMHLAVFGGVIVMQGVTHTANLVFAAQGLCGRNIFLGGGVGIFTGLAVTDTMAELAFFGIGLSIFIGAGLGIFTGCEITLINALSNKEGCGLAVGLGAGMALFFGVAFAKDLGITEFAMLGLFMFVGAGRMSLIGCPIGHQQGISGFQTLGGFTYLGAGQMVVVGSTFSFVGGITSYFGLGGAIVVGAGDLVVVQTAFTDDEGISAFGGQGTQVFVGAGSAEFLHVNYSENAGINWQNEEAVAFYVGGRDCSVITYLSGNVSKREIGFANCKLAAQESEGVETEEDYWNVTTQSLLPSSLLEYRPNNFSGATQLYMQEVTGSGRLNSWLPKIEKETVFTSYVDNAVDSCEMCQSDIIMIQTPTAGRCVVKPQCNQSVLSGSNVAESASEIPASSRSTLFDYSNVDLSSDSSGATRHLKRKRQRRNPSSRLLSQTMPTSPSDFVQDSFTSTPTGSSSTTMPDAFVVTADIALACSATSCLQVEDLQHALQDTWLRDLAESQVVVEKYKSPLQLLSMVGIPDTGGRAAAASNTSFAVPLSPACPQLQRFSAYAHTTEDSSYHALQVRLSNSSIDVTRSSIQTELARAQLLSGACPVDIRMATHLHVPSALYGQRLYASNAAVSGLSNSSLPRVWLSINSPVVEVGQTYPVTVSHFDNGAHVGLKLIPSPDNDALASTSYPLHYFRSYNSSHGNETWSWFVLPGFFNMPGTYYLKAFDVAQPGKFALSQAFDVTPLIFSDTFNISLNTGENAAAAAAAAEAATSWLDKFTQSTMNASQTLIYPWTPPSPAQLLEHLTTLPDVQRRRSRRRLGLSDSADISDMTDTTMIRALLDMQNNTQAICAMWKEQVKSPILQPAFRNATLVQMMLDKAPAALQAAPEIRNLYTNNGWSDPAKVQTAIIGAIEQAIDALTSFRTTSQTFNEASVPTSFTDPGTAVNSMSSMTRDWPSIVNQSMTTAERHLARQVESDGNLEALQSLMDSQSAKHMGGYTWSDVSNEATAGLVRQVKSWTNTELMRSVIDDEQIWEILSRGVG